MTVIRMLIKVMKDDGALRMVARTAGKRLDLGVQLLDQSLLMRRDNIHGQGASA